MTDSIFGVPAARNPKKSSKINFARFLSSPSTPGPNLAPMDLCGIFGFSSPSTLGPYNTGFSTVDLRTWTHPQVKETKESDNQRVENYMWASV